MLLPGTKNYVFLAVGLILACLSSVFSYLFIPAFAELFEFHAHVPAATRVLLRLYGLLLLLPLPVLAAWRYWPNRHQRGVAALATGLAVSLVSQAAIRVILFLPVLELGR